MKTFAVLLFFGSWAAAVALSVMIHRREQRARATQHTERTSVTRITRSGVKYP